MTLGWKKNSRKSTIVRVGCFCLCSGSSHVVMFSLHVVSLVYCYLITLITLLSSTNLLPFSFNSIIKSIMHYSYSHLNPFRKSWFILQIMHLYFFVCSLSDNNHIKFTYIYLLSFQIRTKMKMFNLTT